MTTPEVIAVRNLTKRFGSFLAVNNITFSVSRGEVVGFLGPNGSGKSTTIRMLSGIITPSSGSGRVAGYDIISQSELIKQSIGYMSQKFSLYEDLTPLENLRFYLGIYNVPVGQWEERIASSLEIIGSAAAANRLTGDLPPGWRQRLALSCALLHRPTILFLDEPTSGVDPLTRRRFWGLIERIAGEGVAVFVSTHYLDEARHCQRIILINEGRIVASGHPDEITRAACPGSPGADLNQAFITLLSRPTKQTGESK